MKFRGQKKGKNASGRWFSQEEFVSNVGGSNDVLKFIQKLFLRSYFNLIQDFFNIHASLELEIL